MRVYELAKKLNVSSKEIIEYCSKKGTDLASHMSIIPETLVAGIQTALSKQVKTTITSTQSTPRTSKEKSPEKKATQQSPMQKGSDQPPTHKKETEAASLTGAAPRTKSASVDKPRSSSTRTVAAKATASKAPTSEEKKVSVSHSTAQESAMPQPAIETQKSKQQAPPSTPISYTEPNIFLDEDNFEEKAEFKSTHPDQEFDEQLYTTSAADQERIAKLLSAKIFKDLPAQPVRRRKKKRRRMRTREEMGQKNIAVTEVKISGSMPLFEVAALFNKPIGDLIMALIKRNMVCNRNHMLSPDLIESLAEHYQIDVEVVRSEDATQTAAVAAALGRSTTAINGQRRWPVVVVMGHVDHGKTTLLDHIKSMRIAATEHGGITQHIRAWDVDTAHGKIVFLDTPGHEAFSFLRERGSQVTDVAVLVVAADDGVKPQTVEAIKHARAAGVPIIVAINKIDKITSPTQIETVKRQLSQHDLMPEEWGGQTMLMPISAKTGQGVDQLLEILALQAEVLDLYADFKAPAKAFVLESRIDKGLGLVATVIVKEGTLKVGDFFVSGSNAGKIRLLVDCHGKRFAAAPPSSAVQVTGFDSSTLALGQTVEVVSAAEYAKARNAREMVVETSEALSARNAMASLDGQQTAKSLNVIIKTDTRGSKEALSSSLEKLGRLAREVGYPLQIISSNIGDITEGDIELADNTQAVLLGLHVKIEKNAQSLAKHRNIAVNQFNIIYEVLDFVTELIEAKRKPEIIVTKTGVAVVKKVFNIKGVGVIAGCYMREGTMTRNSLVSCVRNGKTIGQGKIVSLQKEKKSVKEIHAGQECGFMTDTFHDWAEDDTVVCSIETQAPAKAKSASKGS